MMYLSMKAHMTSSGSLLIFGASLTHSKQWAMRQSSHLKFNFLSRNPVIWPSGCVSLSRYSEKNASSLCWNMHTPVMGFWHKYVLLSLIAHFLYIFLC